MLDSRKRLPQVVTRSTPLRRLIRYGRFRTGRVHDSEFRILQDFQLAEPDLIVDVGAHEGQSMLSLRSLFPKSRILAFEPNPFVWKELDRSARWAGSVEVSHVAIADQDDEIVLHIPDLAGYRSTQGATLNRDFTESRRCDFERAYRQSEFDYLKVVTQVRSLDSLDIRAELLKIDVEGAEYRVLQGAIQTLREYRPTVLMEIRGSGPDAVDILVSNNYIVYDAGTRLPITPEVLQRASYFEGATNIVAIPRESL